MLLQPGNRTSCINMVIRRKFFPLSPGVVAFIMIFRYHPKKSQLTTLWSVLASDFSRIVSCAPAEYINLLINLHLLVFLAGDGTSGIKIGLRFINKVIDLSFAPTLSNNARWPW